MSRVFLPAVLMMLIGCGVAPAAHSQEINKPGEVKPIGNIRQPAMRQPESQTATKPLPRLLGELALVGEAVKELESSLDALSVGPSERQVVRIDFVAPLRPMTLAELLEWAETFTAEEAVDAIGHSGACVIKPTLQSLHQYASADELRAWFSRHPRAGSSLEALREHLRRARETADEAASADWCAKQKSLN